MLSRDRRHVIPVASSLFSSAPWMAAICSGTTSVPAHRRMPVYARLHSGARHLATATP
jgi:hypothetical protein